MNTKSIVAVCFGGAAVATIVAAEIMGWPLGIASSAVLGGIAGFVPGYLAPNPNQTRKRAKGLMKAAVSAADTVIVDKEDAEAAISSEELR